MNLRIAIACVCMTLVLLCGVQVVSAAPAPGVSWATKAGGTGSDVGNEVSALPDGSSIVTGYFTGTATFGSTTLTSSSPWIHIFDVFTAKMNADGTWAWANKAGGEGWDESIGVSALPDGSSIVTGYFGGPATFGSTTLRSAGTEGGDHMFTAKMNANGTWAWATQAGQTGSGAGFGVSALPDGSSIVTGYFSDTATFGSTLLTSGAGIYDVFTAKMNANGTWVWATQAGGTGESYGNGVSALPDGSSIVTGYFNGTATFGSTTLISGGSFDVFTAKMNADGTWAWATRVGGTGEDSGANISALPDGSSILTGYFNGTATFGSTVLTSGGGSLDVFTAKMNADGTWAWATKAGGTGSDLGNGISALPDGSSIVTGDFEGAATFGSTTLTSAGDYDVFTAKMDTDGTWAWAIKAGGTGVDSGRSVSALPDGSSIGTGQFIGTAAFGSTFLTSSSAGSEDVFTARYLDAPGAPTQVAVAQPAAGDSTAVVSFLAPGANGGTPITGYRATCSSSTGAGEAEAATSSADSLRISVEGLTLGATYTCAVRARNIVGEGQPSAASNSFITSALAAPAVAGELSPLRSSFTCRGNACTTRGLVPPGATAVTQRATTSAAPAAQSREMAKPKVKTAKGTCRITKRGKGKKATRTYQCTIRLSKGKWTITTKALKKTTAIAQSVKIKTVK